MEITYDGTITIVLMGSKLDALISNEIEVKLIEVADSGSKKILCDFSNTEYISSSGLRVMLSIAKKLQKNSGKIVLSCMRLSVYDVFKITGLTNIFEIYENRQQAIASLQ
jgi:anti-sigma B factor antagonist